VPSLDAFLRPEREGLRGPSPTYEPAHLVLAFLTIGASGYVGRQALAVQTGLGGGAIRTVLKKLREAGYVDASASGCHLTEAGKVIYAFASRKLSLQPLEKTSTLTVGAFQAALAVRGGGRSVRRGIEQRDSAILVGASGATTYVIRAGRFTIPGSSNDCERDFPSAAWTVLRTSLGPMNGDAVILCGARDETRAKIGALAAGLTLL
jgi:Domain of unknown function (DUF4443)